MTERKNLTNNTDWKPERIQDGIRITDPKLARILLHRDKKRIISDLIEKEMTIQELSSSTEINPGTIKRHLDNLISNKLVFMSRQERTKYNVKQKFYSAVARQFIIDIKIPEEQNLN